MAITDKKTGVWGLDQTYNKINQGSIWDYSNSGQLWAIGYNDYGELGQNDRTNYSSPVQVGSDTTWKIPESNSGIHNVADGANGRNLFIKTDGTLWAWGYNAQGHQGHNNRTDYSSPVQVGSDTDWKVVSLYTPNNVQFGAIKTDGTLWTCGENNYGNLGLNNTTRYSSPVQIPGTTWAQILSAPDASAAIKTDGTLWAWGRNHQGQLAQNSITTDYSSPIQIGSETTWKEIAGGYRQLAAIKTDGTLWAWGVNSYGQLGQNSQGSHPSYSNSMSSPVQIPGTTWRSIKGGNSWFSATKTDGTLWAWGYNSFRGNLGVNNLTNYSSPVQIPGTTWNFQAVNSYTQFVTKTDGTLWAWGQQTRGALGQNNLTSYSSPVQIPGTHAAVIPGASNAFPMKYP